MLAKTENSENLGSSKRGSVCLITCISGNNDQNVTKFGMDVHRQLLNAVKQRFDQYLCPSLRFIHLSTHEL